MQISELTSNNNVDYYNTIVCTVHGNKQKRKKFHIHIKFSPLETLSPFKLERMQFPFVLDFAKINTKIKIKKNKKLSVTG